MAKLCLVYTLTFVAIVCTLMVVVDGWSWTGTVLSLGALYVVAGEDQSE